MNRMLRAGAGLLALFVSVGAEAAIVTGSFSGVVTGGFAKGNFGYSYDEGGVLTGKAITGTFSYDTAALGTLCPSAASYMGAYFYGCFGAHSGVTITHTIDGVTEVFDGNPSPLPGLAWNNAQTGLTLYNLVDNTMNLGMLSMIGSPAQVYNQRQTGLSVRFENGAIADPSNPVVNYSGPAGSSQYGPMSIDGLLLLDNQGLIYQLTEGFYTQNSEYSFSITSFQSAVDGAVPEPATWGMMILGFGMVGASLRTRSRKLRVA